MKIIMAALTLLLTFALSHPAEAKRHHRHHVAKHASYAHGSQSSQDGQGCVSDNSGHSVCRGSANQAVAYGDWQAPVDKSTRSSRRQRIRTPTMDASYDGRIVGHPAGCPHTAFCGCGVSVKVFGRPVRNLFLASNWLKYPRATPGPGMVAARHGHVMYIEAIDANGNAVVYDPNSGGHQTRVHTRSLAGYRVVNPHGA